MNITSILIVGIGGFLGSIVRYISVYTIDRSLNSYFPYGTLTVNLAGSFVLGLVVGFLNTENQTSDNWKLFLTTGFCGGFTTFSAFTLENVTLIQQRLVTTSLLYTFLSIVAGFACVLAGLYLGRLMN